MKKTIRLLIVEDSENDALLLVRRLQRDGYSPMFEQVYSEAALKEALEKHSWDIIISDYVMPELDGLEVLRLLSETHPDIPCIITSGKITDETAVAAMKAGAKDYIMKDNLTRLSPAVERELNEVAERRERRKIEAALRENERFSAVLTNNSPNPIIVFNEDHSIRYVNPAFEKITGFSSKEIIGRKVPFPWWPGEKIELYTAEFNSKILLEIGPERLFQKKNGEPFWVSIVASSVKDESGRNAYHITSWVDITEQKRLRDELKMYSQRITRIQEEERKHVARDLHDDTAQSLAILKLELDAIINANGIQSEKTLKKLIQLKDDTDRALQDVRRYSYELRPGVLDYLGLVAALEQLAAENSCGGKLKAKFEVSGEEFKLADDEEITLFRIAQEAVNNARKHAQASRITVNLHYFSGKIVLSIIDNGIGFDPKETAEASINRGSLGLVGMRERAQLIGADLKIESEPGKGATVTIELKTEGK